MKPIVKFSALKRIVNGKDLRISQACGSKLDSKVNELIEQACTRAKESKATQLKPEHFD